MSDKLHVIFGTGPVGMAILDELAKQGQRVRMVNRSGKTSEPLPSGVEVMAGNVADPAFASHAAAGASVIYNALNPAYSQWVALFAALQAGAIAAAAANHAKLVVMDNLYMYGDPQGQPMSEERPHQAHTKKGQLRAAMARDLLAAHHAGRVQVVVGRAADFIGPRVWVSALGGDLVIKPAVQGKAAQVVGDIDTPHSYTYMPDIGRALVALAADERAFGQVWHLPTPPAVSTRRMLELIYAAAGHPLKVQVAPKWLLRLVGLFNPDAREVVEMVYEFEQPFLIDDRKFRHHFGWGATDLETVIGETVGWFQGRV
jgi:nucleoside-diphosphate-sugar epimerase